ncbi:MAG: hypothetical protein LAO51_15555, partial [Acidobacteriia bacterium]|nr:hypothetical protein [Terriglobia bacterium]
ASWHLEVTGRPRAGAKCRPMRLSGGARPRSRALPVVILRPMSLLRASRPLLLTVIADVWFAARPRP